eukprot:g14730.t1
MLISVEIMALLYTAELCKLSRAHSGRCLTHEQRSDTDTELLYLYHDLRHVFTWRLKIANVMISLNIYKFSRMHVTSSRISYLPA